MKLEERSLASWLVSLGVLVALLVYGRPLLVPLAFALMLWAVLNALKNFLHQRLLLPTVVAWVVTFAMIGAALYFVALVLANEAAAITGQVPVYGDRLQALWTRYVPYRRYFPALDFATIWQQYNLAGMVARTAASIGGLLLELALIAIYVGFLLAEQRSLPAKLAHLQGSREGRAQSAEVVGAIGAQVQSYLGVCTFLSVLMGVICYATLTWLHVDFAGFWALVMFLLTYIPTIGAVGTALPAATALAQFGEAGPALIILVVLFTAHFLLTNVVMTVLLGRSMNLSPFAIIVSLTFWGLVWGIAGLFLAVPLTGAAAIACRHLDGLEWIADLLAGPPPRRWSRARHEIAN